MSLADIATRLHDPASGTVTLIYAFNGTGKTRLCVEYKNHTKAQNNGAHSGLYYNAFSEDLFVWDNDEANQNADLKLEIKASSLNKHHGLLTEDIVGGKLAPYFPRYRFEFEKYPNPEDGIRSVRFFTQGEEARQQIKISRGEERIFIWCFFLGLFDVEELAKTQDKHFFIDDPVSSLDDYNVFVTADSILKLVDDSFPNKRILVTTHHIGFFAILADRLTKGDKASRYKNNTKLFLLGREGEDIVLNKPKGDVFLFHLHLAKTLDDALRNGLYAYHFVLLRQLLENVSSFLGAGNIGYVLEQIGIGQPNDVAARINSLSHKDAFQFQSDRMAPAEEDLFKDIFSRLLEKYSFRF